MLRDLIMVVLKNTNIPYIAGITTSNRTTMAIQFYYQILDVDYIIHDRRLLVRYSLEIDDLKHAVANNDNYFFKTPEK